MKPDWKKSILSYQSDNYEAAFCCINQDLNIHVVYDPIHATGVYYITDRRIEKVLQTYGLATSELHNINNLDEMLSYVTVLINNSKFLDFSGVSNISYILRFDDATITCLEGKDEFEYSTDRHGEIQYTKAYLKDNNVVKLFCNGDELAILKVG